MRIDPRIRAQGFEAPPARDLATELRAAELQAQQAQPLQQNPALRAFQGESSFEGPGAVQSAQRSPALQAFQGVSGFDGPPGVQQPQEEARIPGALQPGDLNNAPWPGVREWLKTLLGLK